MPRDRIDNPHPHTPEEENAPSTREGLSPAQPGDQLPPTLVLRRQPPNPPTLLAVSQASAASPTSPPDDERPSVPGFEILAEIGRGGMGVVYRARQISLDRIVALKMLHPGPEGPGATLARFRSEAESIGRLHHPNIIQVHEVGTCPGGPYFVLEYAGGGSLAGRMAGIPQPAVSAATLIRTLARAVHVAHASGIVHRDLKPGNILLAEGPDTPLDQCTPKISDFGLARRLDDAHGLTLSGQVMGTPGYMPPEQAQGPAKRSAPAATSTRWA
jgi:serine/threonine-protein kinase